MHVEASATVAAPKEVVAGVYRDYGRWPAVFPTISAVRLLREEEGREVLEVDVVMATWPLPPRPVRQ